MVTGILVVAMSSFMGRVPGNITEVTSKTNGLFVSPLFNLFFMALFVKFATPFGTIMGSVYGLFAAFVVAFWDVLTGGPGVTFLWIGPGSLIVSVCMSMLFSLIPTRGKGVAVHVALSALLLVPPAIIIVILSFL